MCCIIYVPANVRTPKCGILKLIYNHNHDGIGFCDSEGHSFHTLNFKAFRKALEQRPVDANLIIHFRWATHGSVKPENCHPFFDENNGMWFAHNGVMPIRSINDKTDSEIFFRDTFIPLYNMIGDMNDRLWRLVDDIRGTSRFAIMDRDGDVTLKGRWFEKDGVFYSNLNWQPIL